MAVTNVIDQTKQSMQQIGKISSLNPELTYSYIIRDTFYNLVPTEFKQYYLYNVRTMLNWYHGYVPEFHDPRNGIFSTRIGNSIVKELSKLIVGGQVFIENKNSEANPNSRVNATVKKFQDYSDKYRFQDFVKKLVEYTLAGGTSAIVLSINNERDLVPKLSRIDQFLHSVDFSGNVINYTGFIKSYTAEIDKGMNRGKECRNYYLLENRYYNEQGYPCYKINMKYGIASVVSGQEFDSRETNDVQWEQLPKVIRTSLKRDYGNIFKIGIEQRISTGIPQLGVLITKLNAANTIPEVDLGESALANVISYLIGYEQAYSEMITDLYLGRGKVLVPQQMRNPTDTNNVFYSDFDGMLFTKMPYNNEKDQSPLSVQFELRAQEWILVRNNAAENIASAIGVAGSDLFSYLKDSAGGSKTATQIASESQKTISYIEEKRVMFRQVLDYFLRIWEKYEKADDEIRVVFSSQNHVNMLVTTEQTRVMHEVGFSYFDTYKKMFADYDDAQIQEMVDRKYAQIDREEMIKAKYNRKEEPSVEKPKVKGGEIVIANKQQAVE